MARRLVALVVLLALAIAARLLIGPSFGLDARVLALRLPRVVLGCIVGAGLATTGAVLQSISGNPLADPFVIGASSGAAVGVTVARWLRIPFTSPLLLLLAVVGAFAAIVLVLRIARAGARTPVQTLLLAGVTVSTLGTAVVLLYYSLRPEDASKTMLFLMGNLDEGNGWFVGLAGAAVAAALVAAQLGARALDAFAMGETTARHLGVDVERFKLGFCWLAAALVGVVVAVAGLIGFVGLIVPHVARRLVGVDHRRLVPACVLVGASFLLLADVVAQTVAAPQTLSIGAITALCGGPFFLHLLRRRVRERDALAQSVTSAAEPGAPVAPKETRA
jgi:iron complex transport system permease protein